MTTGQTIAKHVDSLPQDAQQEVLDFVVFIERRRTQEQNTDRENIAWSNFSLSAAMRGMEDEDSPYTPADIKESFQ